MACVVHVSKWRGDGSCRAGAGLAPILLDMQYRMHPLIAEFPSARFYQGMLKTGIAAEERPLPKGTPLQPLTVLQWIPCLVYHLQRSLWAATEAVDFAPALPSLCTEIEIFTTLSDCTCTVLEKKTATTLSKFAPCQQCWRP